MNGMPGTHQQADARHCRAGFTLVEMVLVVLVIGLIAAVTSPRYSDAISRYRLETAAARVAADLRHARWHARTKGTTQQVVFTPASHTYSLTGMNDINHPTQPFTVDLTTTSSPVTIVSVSFGAGGTGNTLIFDMYGRPDYGGNVVITTGGQQRTIVVEEYTGNVSVQP